MKSFLTLSLAGLFCLAGSASAQDKKHATIKVLLPEAALKLSLKVEGNELPANEKASKEGVRILITPDLEPGKTYAYKIEATIEPNNYTAIIRAREVSFKSGDNVTLDLSKKDDKFPDDIRIKWVPTPKEVVIEMGKLARIGKQDVVCDLGCGDGIMLVTAIKEFGAKKGIGIDVDPVQITAANNKVREAGLAESILIRSGNVLDVTADQLDDANVVMIYMGDEVNLRLRPKLWTMLKPGSRIVSHRFTMGDWKPNKLITVKDLAGDEYNLHLWIVSGKEKDGKYDKKEE